MESVVLLDLMGGVALLLWGLHMVHSGILRAFGPDLRQFLARALSNRFTAFAAGIGLTALLQSSTATLLRDLRRIHSHICSVAYPVLDAAGELPAHRAAENELVALPSSVAQPLSR